MCHAKQHNNDNKMLDINMISYGWIQQQQQPTKAGFWSVLD